MTSLALSADLGTGPFAVATHGLRRRFGRVTALDGLDLRVPTGAVYVLAGPNGAGKSTLLKTLLNLARPTEGGAEVLGLDGPEVRARAAYMAEAPVATNGWMRVDRLLAHHATYRPSWDAAYAQRLTNALEVPGDRKVKSLSKGQARRLQFVTALAWRPELLLLDEPTDGLDPVARDTVLQLLSEHLADTGCTILISTHLIHEVDRLIDHVGVLRDGRLVAQLPRDELRSRLRVWSAEGPDGWVGPAEVPGIVLHRDRAGREIRWTVWGDERGVTAAIAGSGGAVREARPLPLDESVLTLLRSRELS